LVGGFIPCTGARTLSGRFVASARESLDEAGDRVRRGTLGGRRRRHGPRRGRRPLDDVRRPRRPAHGRHRRARDRLAHQGHAARAVQPRHRRVRHPPHPRAASTGTTTTAARTSAASSRAAPWPGSTTRTPPTTVSRS